MVTSCSECEERIEEQDPAYCHRCYVKLMDAGVPNLDDQAPADLRACAKAFRSLAEYADGKATAKTLRANGAIVMAKSIEDDLDAIYDQLPKWARW